MNSTEVNIEKAYSTFARCKEQPSKGSFPPIPSATDTRLRKLDATYSQLTRRLDERIQLRVIKSVVSANCDTVKEKENAITEESRELASLFEEVWAAEDSYCNRIWSFATQHNFHEIFSQHKITEPIKHKCPYDTTFEAEKNYTDADVDKDIAVVELTLSIEHLREKIVDVSSNMSVKREIEKLLKELGELQSFSEEVSVVLKLIDEHAKSERERKRRQNVPDVLNSTFVSAKKLAKCSNYYPRVLIQRENIPRLMKYESEKIPPIKTQMRECAKKFTVKKQSEIALKFEKKNGVLQCHNSYSHYL